MNRQQGPLVAATLVMACLASLPAAQARASDEPPGDPQAGARSFVVCSACHSTQRDSGTLIGPNLWAVVDRPVASATGFEYSPDLKVAGGTWTRERLDQFLTSPMTFAPGTRMGFVGIADPQERANVIAYLATLAEGTAVAAAPVTDYGPDWPAGPGQAEAGQLCNSCHSLAIVKQQRLSRSTWDKLLHWMVSEQGMAPQAPERRELILDYLAANFGAPD
jgi:cytochrome c